MTPIKTSLIIFLIVANSIVVAKNLESINLGNVIVDEVVSVSNAGTFKVHAMNTPGIYLYNTHIFFADLDIPQSDGSCQAERKKARLAKRLITKKLASAKKIELRHLRQTKSILVKTNIAVIADVFVDGINLGSLLVRQDLAAYKKSRKNWCER